MSYDKQAKSHSGSGGSGHFGPPHEKKRDVAAEAAEQSVRESES